MTNYGNITKATYQADIKRKQAFFNRCKRRFQMTKSTAERQFLKSEAVRVCTELKACCKVWKNCGWGSFNWITKGFTTTNFNNTVKTAGRKNTTTRAKFSGRTTASRTTSSRRGTGRTYARRGTSTRSNARTNNSTRSNAARVSYVAW